MKNRTWLFIVIIGIFAILGFISFGNSFIGNFVQLDVLNQTPTYKSIPYLYSNPPRTLSDSPEVKHYRRMARNYNFYGLVKNFEENYTNSLSAPDLPFRIYLRSLGYVGEWRKGVRLSKEYLENNPGDPAVIYHLLTLRELYGDLSWGDRNKVMDLINRMEPETETELANYHFALGQMYYNAASTKSGARKKESLKEALSHFYRVALSNPMLRENARRVVNVPGFIISTNYLLNRRDASNFLLKYFLVDRDDFVKSRAIGNLDPSFYSRPDEGLTEKDKKLQKHLVKKFKNLEAKTHQRRQIKDLSKDDFLEIINNENSKKYHMGSSIKLSALYKLGYFHLREDNYDKAFNAYQRILDVTPNYAEIHANVSAIHSTKGDTDKALEAFKKDVRNNWKNKNKSGNNHLNLINRALEAERHELADKWAKKYLSYFDDEKGYLDKRQLKSNLDVNQKLLEYIMDDKINLRVQTVEENISYLRKELNLNERLLESARRRGREDVEELLETGADVNVQNENGVTALMYAVQKGDEKLVKRLIEAGADVNLKNNYGRKALDMVPGRNNPEIVKLLRKNGAEKNTPSKIDRRLIKASKNGNTDKVRMLVEKGANVNTTGDSGLTPLIIETMNGHTEILNLLIDEGADVNARGASGKSALIEAVEREHRELVKTLVQHGANPNLRIYETGKTALTIAVKDGHARIVEILIDAGVNPNLRVYKTDETALVIGVKEGHAEIVEMLVEAGASVNESAHYKQSFEKMEWTALMAAVDGGNKKIIETLLRAGAKIDAQDHHGMTPLMIAAKNGDVETVELLIDAGADITKRNRNSLTALRIARRNDNKESAELINKHSSSSDFFNWF